MSCSSISAQCWVTPRDELLHQRAIDLRRDVPATRRPRLLRPPDRPSSPGARSSAPPSRRRRRRTRARRRRRSGAGSAARSRAISAAGLPSGSSFSSSSAPLLSARQIGRRGCRHHADRRLGRLLGRHARVQIGHLDGDHRRVAPAVARLRCPPAPPPARCCRRRARRTRRRASPPPPARRRPPRTRARRVEVRRRAANHRAQADDAVEAPLSATRRASPGISMAPGQRKSSTSSVATPVRRSASCAPSISFSTMKSLKRAATMAKRRPLPDSPPREPGRRVGAVGRCLGFGSAHDRSLSLCRSLAQRDHPRRRLIGTHSTTSRP